MVDEQQDRPGTDPRAGRDRFTAGLCAGTAVVAVVVFWVVHHGLVDDAYISLSYARNLAYHGHWGLIRAESANTATSPLHVVILAAGFAVLRGPDLAGGAAYVGASVAFAYWTACTTRHLCLPRSVSVLGVALVLLNPFMLGAAGMEATLVVAFMAGLLCYSVQGRPVAFGVVAGLAVLTRIDQITFVALMAFAAPPVRRQLPKATAAAMAVVTPWFLFSWIHFGSAIPDSSVIKTAQNFGPSFDTGLLSGSFLHREPLPTVVGLIPALLGGVILTIWAVKRLTSAVPQRCFDPIVAMGAGGALYFGFYSLLGVPPYEWYYCPVVSALSLTLALLIGPALGGIMGRWWTGQHMRAAILVVLASMIVAQVALVVAHDFKTPFFFGNWATSAEYQRIGAQLRTLVGDRTVTGPGEIGRLAFTCDCTIVDEFSDRGRVMNLLTEHENSGALTGVFWKLNFYLLDHSARPRRADYELARDPPPGPGQWTTHASSGVARFRLLAHLTPVQPRRNGVLAGRVDLTTVTGDERVARIDVLLSGGLFLYRYPIGVATRRGCCRWIMSWDTRWLGHGKYLVTDVARDINGDEIGTTSYGVRVAN